MIIKDSLLLRLEQVKRKKFGKGVAKRKSQDEVEAKDEGEAKAEAEVRDRDPGSLPKEAPVDSAGKRPPSRYIPIEVRNAVWERDQGRCAFMSERGRWCSERRFLEYHHIIPFAWGGETTVDNLELRCRTHNGYEGELLFGKVLRRSAIKSRFAGKPTGFKTSAENRRPEQMR